MGACGREGGGARHIAAQSRQQSKWVVGRNSQCASNRGALPFLGKQTAEYCLADGIIIFGFTLGHRARQVRRIGGGQPIRRIGKVHRAPAIDRKRPGNKSEERRVGNECVSTCRSWWSPDY